MKLCISGSRDYPKLYQVEQFIAVLPQDIIILEGEARGVDQTARKAAEKRGMTVDQWPANWSLGKSAGVIRNQWMLKAADWVVVFWDGKSPGARDMVQHAHKADKLIAIVRPEDGDGGVDHAVEQVLVHARLVR